MTLRVSPVQIIHNIPDYDGPGVYALIDQNGKRYIGSSKHVRRRIIYHHITFRRILKSGTAPHTGKKIIDGVLSGNQFTAVLLEKLPEGGCYYDLMDLEKKALEECGGCANTYNGMPIKNYRKEDYFLFHLWEKETSERSQRIARELLDRIHERERPILSDGGRLPGDSTGG